MRMEVFDEAAQVAERAANIIADAAREAVSQRGQFALAVSGGKTPWLMLRSLVDKDVPWEQVQLFQVDERIAPAGDLDRNLTQLTDAFLTRVSLPTENVHAMPVEAEDLEAAARSYGQTLERVAGSPPVFDLIHLGLGPDGHTASLVPGDPVLNVMDADVALTGLYQGRRRMTLTYPVLNRARRILWLVTGADKTDALARLLAADPSIPAGRVSQAQGLVLAGREAAGNDPE